MDVLGYFPAARGGAGRGGGGGANAVSRDCLREGGLSSWPLPQGSRHGQWRKTVTLGQGSGVDSSGQFAGSCMGRRSGEMRMPRRLTIDGCNLAAATSAGPRARRAARRPSGRRTSGRSHPVDPPGGTTVPAEPSPPSPNSRWPPRFRGSSPPPQSRHSASSNPQRPPELADAQHGRATRATDGSAWGNRPSRAATETFDGVVDGHVPTMARRRSPPGCLLGDTHLWRGTRRVDRRPVLARMEARLAFASGLPVPRLLRAAAMGRPAAVLMPVPWSRGVAPSSSASRHGRSPHRAPEPTPRRSAYGSPVGDMLASSRADAPR
jgi:hypothetical protein